MRRTSPDLVGTRKQIFRAVSIGLLVLSVGYALWVNYVAFVGGNLPLTNVHLTDGGTGTGLVMLAVGDLALVLVLWFVIDGVLLNLLYMVLSAGASRSTATPAAPYPSSQGQQPQGAPQQQWQPQGQQQWQPQGQQQWQPQGQQQWQPQGQQQWGPQGQWGSQQQWQPQGPQQEQQGPQQQGPANSRAQDWNGPSADLGRR